jgi:hypothetical protein
MEQPELEDKQEKAVVTANGVMLVIMNSAG